MPFPGTWARNHQGPQGADSANSNSVMVAGFEGLLQVAANTPAEGFEMLFGKFLEALF